MMAAPTRNRLIGAVHAARKAAGLDDDTYRAMLHQHTGKSSAKDMSDAELRRVLDHLNSGKPKGAGRRFAPPRTTNPTASKARALWISLHALGAIEDASEPALRAWVKRQYKVDDLAFVRPADSFAVIEGLKQWAARLGVQWGAYAEPRLCVIECQIAILRRRRRNDTLCAQRLRGIENLLDDLESSALDRLIAELGAMLRGDHV